MRLSIDRKHIAQKKLGASTAPQSNSEKQIAMLFKPNLIYIYCKKNQSFHILFER
jgi:hypothetical protein